MESPAFLAELCMLVFSRGDAFHSGARLFLLRTGTPPVGVSLAVAARFGPFVGMIVADTERPKNKNIVAAILRKTAHK